MATVNGVPEHKLPKRSGDRMIEDPASLLPFTKEIGESEFEFKGGAYNNPYEARGKI